MSRRVICSLVPLLLLLASACTQPGSGAPTGSGARTGSGAPAGSGAPPPFADCTALTAPPASAAARAEPASTVAGSVGAAPGAATEPTNRPRSLPDLELPCFTGGQAVQLSALRGPAIINLWGAWCPPCRDELPVLQRYAERAAGAVHVIGVDTFDDRAAAQSLAEDLQLTYPNLFDPGEKLRLKLERHSLPVTLFVDEQGKVRHIYNSVALDDASLERLARQHLGVTIP